MYSLHDDLSRQFPIPCFKMPMCVTRGHRDLVINTRSVDLLSSQAGGGCWTVASSWMMSLGSPKEEPGDSCRWKLRTNLSTQEAAAPPWRWGGWCRGTGRLVPERDAALPRQRARGAPEHTAWAIGHPSHPHPLLLATDKGIKAWRCPCLPVCQLFLSTVTDKLQWWHPF